MLPDLYLNHKGQPENQNACQHGSHSRAFSEELKANITRTERLNGLHDEIVLLRDCLKSVVNHNPENEAASNLAHLMCANRCFTAWVLT